MSLWTQLAAEAADDLAVRQASSTRRRICNDTCGASIIRSCTHVGIPHLVVSARDSLRAHSLRVEGSNPRPHATQFRQQPPWGIPRGGHPWPRRADALGQPHP